MTILSSLLSIYVILCIASAIVYFLINKFPTKNYTELTQRIKSWWVMVTIFSFALAINKNISLIFFAFMSFLALKEYFSIIQIRKSDRNIIFISYIILLLQYYLISQNKYELFILFIPIITFIFMQISITLLGNTKKFHYASSSINWGLTFFVYFLSHLAFLLTLPPIDNISLGGVGLVLYLVFLTQFNDVSQYVWGKSFGKHKIVPKISKNKTWEGFIGGIFTTALLSYFISTFLTPFDNLTAILVGISISILGFLGDVTISALKRDLNIKDTSKLLPGHGGILDRVDSLIYSAPIFFHFVYQFYYQGVHLG